MPEAILMEPKNRENGELLSGDWIIKRLTACGRLADSRLLVAQAVCSGLLPLGSPRTLRLRVFGYSMDTFK